MIHQWLITTSLSELVLILCLGTFPAKAQDTTAKHSSFLRPSTEFNPGRLAVVSGSMGGLFGSAMVGLNEYWYKNYERTSFHFFDDSREWRGMDKAGHMYSGYFMSRFSGGLYRWSGIDRKKAALTGSLTSIVMLASVEVLDGFSAKWGASWADFGANVAGAAVFYVQEMAWQEQRISLKFSAHPVDHPDDLTQRADDLYGHTIAERILKDYNGATYWASVNIDAFLADGNPVPKWINVAVGYGAQNMYGGFTNKWCSKPKDAAWDEAACKDVQNRHDMNRYSQFYLSPDIDFSKIQTDSKALKTFLTIVNMLKLPAPALEVNTKGGLIFHPVQF